MMTRLITGLILSLGLVTNAYAISVAIAAAATAASAASTLALSSGSDTHVPSHPPETVLYRFEENKELINGVAVYDTYRLVNGDYLVCPEGNVALVEHDKDLRCRRFVDGYWKLEERYDLPVTLSQRVALDHELQGKAEIGAIREVNGSLVVQYAGARTASANH